MTIIFHKPSEFERFQTRIGCWSIEDVANVYAQNLTREMYGNTENTIQFVIPNR